jgi:regulation of enolase protein 1 (concanavalin A-like superfamily)
LTSFQRGTALFALLTSTLLSAGRAHAQQGSWLAADVGNPSLAGSASKLPDGGWQIHGSGNDIWNESDQFHFVYQTITGDTQITARITSLQAADAWSKAGLMIREALSPGARHAFALVSGEAGVAFQRRSIAGQSTDHTGGWGTGPSVWLRLTRVGSRFIAYQSADGQSWSLIGDAEIAMQAEVHLGLAVTSHVDGATATGVFSDITVASPSDIPPPDPASPQPAPPSQPSVPEPWATTDVGAPALSGTAAENSGTFLLLGAGADIWDRSDQFRFVHQQFAGDVEVVARVTALTYGDQWSKAGVMIRDSLEAGASHAFTAATAGSSWTFQRRPHAAGDSYATAGPQGAAPGWVRLVREGSLITSYVSADGSTWIPVGSDTVTMGAVVHVGLAVTSHNAAQLVTAVFDNVRVGAPTRAGTTQPGINSAPTVALISPAAGSSYSAPGSIPLEAAATDRDGSVARVEFYANGALVGSATAAPYVFTWTNVNAGHYGLTARAYDNGGAATESEAVSITVAAATTTQPTRLAFTQSADAQSTVSYYVVGFYRVGGDGVQVAQMDLGPPSDAQEIEFDVTAIVNTLPAGTYYVTVSAIGPGGVAASDPSPPFTR